MHIPDGFIDIKTAVVGGVLAVAGVGLALRVVRQKLPPRRVPLIGLAAAFIFAAQMLNFPVAAGTSGHLIGAVLAAVLLGPAAAILVMTAVLLLQCLMFADGGVTALGVNIFNMALVAPGVGYGVYRLVCRAWGESLRIRLLGTAFGAWCSTLAAALACAGELAWSGTAAWRVVFPAMAGVHMLIGLGEACITTMVVAAVVRVRPELWRAPAGMAAGSNYREVAALGGLVALGLVVFMAPFACGWPDGLERVAEVLGFEAHAADAPMLPAPLPDYATPGFSSAFASTVVAGAIGAVVAFLVAYVLARALTPAPREVKCATR